MVQLGVSFSLPSGTAEALAKKRLAILEQQRNLQVLQPQSQEETLTPIRLDHAAVDPPQVPPPLQSPSPSQHDSNEVGSEEEEPIMMEAADSILTDDESQGSSQNDPEEEDYDDEDDEDEESVVSLTPPESLPVVVVDLERWCGQAIATAAQAQDAESQLWTHLLGNNSNTPVSERKKEADVAAGVVTTLPQQEEAGDGLSLDFEARVAQLFAHDICIHSDTTLSTPNATTTTSSRKDSSTTHPRWTVTVPYPEFLTRKYEEDDTHNTMTTTATSFLATARLWKHVKRGEDHVIPVVQRVLQHLERSSRSLLWKYEMGLELRQLVQSEHTWKMHRQQRTELKLWKTETRKGQLEQLYEVRDTYGERLELARATIRKLVALRTIRVEQELQRRKQLGIGHGGMTGLDLGSNHFHLDDDPPPNTYTSSNKTSSTLVLDSDDQDAEQTHNDSDYDSGYHDSDNVSIDNDAVDVEDEIMDGASTSPRKMPARTGGEGDDLALKLALGTARSKARRKACSKKRRRRMELETAAVAQRQKLAAARAEEEALQQHYQTSDEKMAIAMVTSLEQQLQKVDGLLESLQDEEWADEEDNHDMNDDDDEEEELEREARLASGLYGTSLSSSNEVANTNANTNKDTMTLLDQILAMILGALPPPHFSGRTTEEHYLFVSREHEEIRSDWKREFGRLPPPTTTTPSTTTTTTSNTTAQEPEIDSEQAAWAEDSRLVAGMNGLQIENNSTAATPEIVPLAVDMRRALGIAENDGADDWDDVEDWDELLPDMNMNMSTATMLLPDHITSTSTSLPTMELPPTHTQPAMSSLRNPTIISSRPKKAGLRPGGKV
eukprot:scaffold62468_cov45-Attheya_sp.AAC.7